MNQTNEKTLSETRIIAMRCHIEHYNVTEEGNL